MLDDIDDRTPYQRKLDAISANIQDASDAFAELAEVTKHIALCMQLQSDPLFLVRPTPTPFSNN